MGHIYVIKNIVNKKIYVGQTTRDIDIRWREHRNLKKRLLSQDIKKYGKDKFKFIFIKEYSNELLESKEIKYIKKYNSLKPNGYNKIIGSHDNLSVLNSSKGGKSEIGHDKQSKKAKERYKDIPKLKNFEVPRGISYWKGFKKEKEYEGFKVRKKNIKSKEFISLVSRNKLEYNLNRSKSYLDSHYE